MTTFEFITSKTNKTSTAAEKKVLKLLNAISVEYHDKPFKQLPLHRKTEVLNTFSTELRDAQVIEKNDIDAKTAKELCDYILSLAVNKVM